MFCVLVVRQNAHEAPRIQTLEIDDGLGWAATKGVVVSCSPVPQRVLGEEKVGWLLLKRRRELERRGG